MSEYVFKHVKMFMFIETTVVNAAVERVSLSVMDDWLKRLSIDAARMYRSRFNGFFVWLRSQEPWKDATPEMLLDFQEQATGRKRFELLNLIQRYVKEKGGTRGSMLATYSALRSFFLHNRVELPRDSWDPGAGTRKPARGKLTLAQSSAATYSLELR